MVYASILRANYVNNVCGFIMRKSMNYRPSNELTLPELINRFKFDSFVLNRFIKLAETHQYELLTLEIEHNNDVYKRYKDQIDKYIQVTKG